MLKHTFQCTIRYCDKYLRFLMFMSCIVYTVDILLRVMQKLCFIHFCNYNIFLFAELVEEFKVFEGWSTALLVRVGREFMWQEINA